MNTCTNRGAPRRSGRPRRDSRARARRREPARRGATVRAVGARGVDRCRVAGAPPRAGAAARRVARRVARGARRAARAFRGLLASRRLARRALSPDFVLVKSAAGNGPINPETRSKYAATGKRSGALRPPRPGSHLRTLGATSRRDGAVPKCAAALESRQLFIATFTTATRCARCVREGRWPREAGAVSANDKVRRGEYSLRCASDPPPPPLSTPQTARRGVARSGRAFYRRVARCGSHRSERWPACLSTPRTWTQ